MLPVILSFSERILAARNFLGSAVIYLAKVRLSVRVGEHKTILEGYCTGAAASDSLRDAHEKGLKSAETDATKGALATFGRPFGLALHVPVNEVEPKLAAPRPAILKATVELGSVRVPMAGFGSFVTAALSGAERVFDRNNRTVDLS